MLVAEHELAFEVGAPQSIGSVGSGELGALGLVAPSFAAFNQAVAIEHGVDRARGWRLDHRQLPDQLVADLRCTPGRVLPLDREDRAFHLERELVGVPIGSATAVPKRVEAALLVAIENLVAGDSGNTELAAQARHLLPVEQPGHESEAFVHRFTLVPGHLGSPQMPVV